MATFIKPKILGLAVWTRRIENFGPIRKRRLQRKFEELGADLVDQVKEAVPVRKGNLRDSIRMEPLDKTPGVKIIAGGTAETARGPTLDEALLTEFGTRKERAEPFFYPTIRANEAAAKNELAADLSDDTED